MCGMAWDINSMILFRGLQGALGAAMIPTVFTTAFVLFPGKQRLIASTTIGALASLAPAIGPVIGGWITDQWSWHWLFYLNLVPGIVVAAARAEVTSISTSPTCACSKRAIISASY